MDITSFLVLLAIALLIVAVVVAWRRYRSRRALMRQVRELQALAEAGRAIAEARLDADELCELIYLHASAMLDTATFQLGLFDGARYNIRLWVREGQRVPPQSFDLSDNPGLIGWVRQSRQPLLVRDFEQERAPLAGDRLFHLRVAEATGNAALVAVVRMLWDQRAGPLYRRLEHHYDTPELWTAAMTEHRAVLKAIAEHDVAGARTAMQRHLNRAYKRFSKGWNRVH